MTDDRENEELYKPVADILFDYIRDMIYSPSKATLDIEKLPKSFANLGEGLTFLNSSIEEVRVFARELASGNLNCSIPSSDNEMAAPLKQLHSALKHLTWQAQFVAKGHYNQRIAFMGDFSEAFNDMINQLKQRALDSTIEKARLKDFLANMSHEIRTPMNAILGMAELSLREEISPAANEYITSIRQASENLLDIINDILDLSKIEMGQLEKISTDYLLSALIADVISVIKPHLLKSHLRFVVHVDNDLPDELFGDVVRIRQIMLNLLSNAVKYTDKGFVSFSIFGKRGKNDNMDLIFSVEDSGRGIAKENLEILFDEFTQFDISKNAGIEGTGLGLAITKNLIESMNGKIRVKSEYGKGSTFTVRIPQKVTGINKLAQVVDRQNHNILIFERREICINSITRTMKDLDLKYKLVSTKEEFLSELKSKKYTFIFLAAALYDSVIETYGKTDTDAMIVLIAEFGEVIPVQNISVLTTPIFSIPMANILNDVSDKYTKTFKEQPETEFTAPEAKVLIVDDLLTNLKVAEGLLQPYKFIIEKNQSGFEALESIKSKQYDLIFMDYVMPDMDGMQTTAKIRDMGVYDQYFNDVPVIALTANAIAGSKEMFLSSGFNDFVAKPIDMTVLNNVLKKWIPADKQITVSKKISPKIPKGDDVDLTDFILKLTHLSDAFDDYDIRSIGERLDDLKNHPNAMIFNDELKDISRFKLTGEYNEAVELIKELILSYERNK